MATRWKVKQSRELEELLKEREETHRKNMQSLIGSSVVNVFFSHEKTTLVFSNGLRLMAVDGEYDTDAFVFVEDDNAN